LPRAFSILWAGPTSTTLGARLVDLTQRIL